MLLLIKVDFVQRIKICYSNIFFLFLYLPVKIGVKILHGITKTRRMIIFIFKCCQIVGQQYHYYNVEIIGL
jgi:hypothetical protein